MTDLITYYGFVGGVMLLAALTGCTASVSGPRQPAPITSSTIARPTATAPADDPYVELATLLHDRKVDIWFESDLVSSWLSGPVAFDAAIQRLGELSSVPGVVGFKVADELGYGDGLASVHEATRFLQAVDSSLSRVAPDAEILVDEIVPELGCLPWRGVPEAACADAARTAYPAATAEATDRYLQAGLIDRLDLSTGLLDDATYAEWGTTHQEAQREAWRHAVARGWSAEVNLQARKALAEVGGYQGDWAHAADDVETFVSIPLAIGANAVDIWTWRQPYDGDTVSLLPADLASNPLWAALTRNAAAGEQFFTHMTPSAMATPRMGWPTECDRVAEVFSSVFVAAGTG
jgi:hypothetical protein